MYVLCLLRHIYVPIRSWSIQTPNPLFFSSSKQVTVKALRTMNLLYDGISHNFFFANSIERVSRFMSRSVAAWKPWHRSTNSTKLDAHAWTFLLAPLPSNFNQRIHLPIFIVVIFLFLLARCLAAIFIFLLALRIGLITAMSFSSCFLLFLFKLRFFLIRL